MATIYNFPIIYWGEDNSTQVEFKITTLMPKGTATTAMCAVVQNQSILMVKPPRGWGLPGGHIEQRETPEQCVLRECIEEASVEVTNLRLIGYWQTTKLKQLPSNAQYPDNGYQLLYMADIKEVLPFKVTHESGAREFMNLVIGYGNTGRLIAAELQAAGEAVSVGRHGSSEQIDGFTAKTVDLLQKDSVVAAVEGAQRVFVTTGLPYKLSIWQQQWPVIIDNVIAACKLAGAKLVFIDNIYLYGPSPLQTPITEEHPRNPVSNKGKVRLELVNKLEAAMQDDIEVLIVRCADFYGPKVNSSGVTMAIDAAAAGKRAYFMGDPNTKHAYSYVPDIAKAAVLLAHADDSYNQTWHTPTAPAISGNELIALVEQELGGKAKWSYLRANNTGLLSLFVPILREMKEMMYQFENDYVFDSTKFATKYPDFAITSYEDGVKATVEASRG